VVFDEEIQISFRDKQKRVATISGSYPNYELVPTGAVCFRARINMNEKDWKDGAQPLEQQLPAILARLEREGQRLADRSIYFQKQHEKYERKEKRERALQARKDREVTDFTKLLEESVRWKKARDLRQYIIEREKHAVANNLVTDKFRRWLDWAGKKADWYDPFTGGKDRLLQGMETEVVATAPENPDHVFRPDSFFEPKHWVSNSFYHKR
jgi:hypothetical protein